MPIDTLSVEFQIQVKNYWNTDFNKRPSRGYVPETLGVSVNEEERFQLLGLVEPSEAKEKGLSPILVRPAQLAKYYRPESGAFIVDGPMGQTIVARYSDEIVLGPNQELQVARLLIKGENLMTKVMKYRYGSIGSRTAIGLAADGSLVLYAYKPDDELLPPTFDSGARRYAEAVACRPFGLSLDSLSNIPGIDYLSSPIDDSLLSLIEEV